jgi:hypothetical protein
MEVCPQVSRANSANTSGKSGRGFYAHCDPMQRGVMHTLCLTIASVRIILMVKKRQPLNRHTDSRMKTAQSGICVGVL